MRSLQLKNARNRSSRGIATAESNRKSGPAGMVARFGLNGPWGWCRAGVALVAVIAPMVLLPAATGVSSAASPKAEYSPAADAGDFYTVGVNPYFSPRQLARLYRGLIVEIGHTLQKRAVFQTRSTFGKFQQALQDETFDVVLMQPYDYIEAADRGSYVALARMEAPLAGRFVTREDSSLRQVSDLEGMTLGLPPKSSAVAVLAHAKLLEARLDPHRDLTVRNFRNHASCLTALVLDAVDACVTAPEPLKWFDSRRKVPLRDFARTAEIPGCLFAVHVRVPGGERHRIRAAILRRSEDHSSSPTLSRQLPRFVTATDSDYDILRETVTLSRF